MKFKSAHPEERRQYYAGYRAAARLAEGLKPEQKIRAVMQLKKLYGLPPYDDASNFLINDGYFAQSIVNEFRMPIEDLEKVSGFRELQEKWNLLRRTGV